jgi:putative toxin-antitoxin system antitoxin component (TIGR02293 family)
MAKTSDISDPSNSSESAKSTEIQLLYKKGVEVMGSHAKFQQWLQTENLALGKIRPEDLLGNSSGLSRLEDELNRIEHGVLA